MSIYMFAYFYYIYKRTCFNSTFESKISKDKLSLRSWLNYVYFRQRIQNACGVCINLLLIDYFHGLDMCTYNSHKTLTGSAKHIGS